MKLVTVDQGGSKGFPGALINSGEILHLARAAATGTIEAWIPQSLREIFEAGAVGLATVKAMVERVEAAPEDECLRLRSIGALTPFRDTRLLAPIPEPSLIIGGGLNYRQHLAEMENTPEPSRPTGFIKVASSVSGPDAKILLPDEAADMVDWEGELGCVIGTRCHAVTPAAAIECIAGYTIINDISARDWVADVFRSTDPWDARQTWELNVMGKNFHGFTAMGPVILTADEMGPLDSTLLETRLNGEVVQSCSPGDVIFDFAQSLSFFSRWYTFQPGDIVTTGSPAGVGVSSKPPRFMRPGDTIEVEVTGIGVLRNCVVSSGKPSP